MIVTGYGSRDTHSLTLHDGKANPHPSAGTPYETITDGRIYEMVQKPPTRDKLEAQWIVPSSYNQHDARSHEVQRTHGSYSWLAVDIDSGGHSKAAVQAVLDKAFGQAWCLIHATATATEAAPKWRVSIPLAQSLTGVEYPAYRAALFDAFEGAGVTVDRSLERSAQLVFLPNRGEWYDYAVRGNQVLDPKAHPIAQRAARYVEMQAAIAEGSGTSRVEGARSHLAAFRRKHSIEDLLHLYGYTRKGSSDHWRSPYQQGSSYATKDLGDGWFSLSQSDFDAGLGRSVAGGGCYGDQFDLYVHYNCHGDLKAAEAYARKCLQDEDRLVLGAATAEHGNQVWDAYSRARSLAAQATAEAIVPVGLEQEEGNNDEWDMPWPPGLVGELAQWIYASSSRPVKQYSIAAALYFFGVCGRKYNVDGKGLNLYMMLVGGTGRGKGVVKSAVDRLVHEIVTLREDPQLAGPFGFEVAVSEGGIRRALSNQNPMCVYEEELGTTLVPLGSARANSNDVGLRKILTRLFDSGQGTKLGIEQASGIDNTKDMVDMPSFTMAGDTQPHVYRNMIGGNMVDAGFAPRMVPFFYYGKRSYHNKDSDRYRTPHKGLVQALATIMEYATKSGEAVVHIPWQPTAREVYENLDIEYTDRINAGDEGAEMFNRAGVIVSRVAGLLAVGIDHLQPAIAEEVFAYAKRCVWAGMEESQRILSSGGAGQGSGVRLFRLKEAVTAFLKMSPDTKIRTYKTPKAVVDNYGPIDERYLLIELKGLVDFEATGNATPEMLIRETIEEAVRQEILQPTTAITLDKRTTQTIYEMGPGW